MSPDLNQQTEAQRHLDRALAALAADLPEQALTRVEKCLRIDPGNLAARLVEARAALASNRPRQALAALDCADLYHPDRRDTPELAMLRAQTLIRCQLDDMAGRQLEHLVEQFPDDVRPRRMLAELHQRRGLTDAAIEHVRHLVRLEPTNGASRRMLAELLQDRDPEASIDLLTRLDGAATDTTTQLLTARLCQKVDRLRDAQELCDSLLHQLPADATVWLESGRLADAIGADALAVTRLERAAALAGGDKAPALTSLALAHMHAGRLATAGRCWWRLARSGGPQEQAWAGLMVCAVACARPALAEKAGGILSMHADEAERRAAIAELWPHAACGSVIRKTIRFDAPAPAEPASTLDALLDSASETLARNAKDHPDRADGHYHLALCHASLGRPQDAGRETRAALALNPAYAAARDLSDQLDNIHADAA